jgi:hypothetical protein
MNFLEEIDNIYKKEREINDIPQSNGDFSCFIPIEAIDYKTSCEFLIKKQEKAKLLFLVGKQRVYLSDLQIIRTILRMGKEDINWFLQQFISLYKGNYSKIQFKILEKTYEGFGIINYSEEKGLLLFSDSEIDINDFVFLLNFIFSKDKYWGEMNELEDFRKKTLCKYISLIDYYSNKSNHSECFLKSIGYPYYKRYPVDNKKLFNNIEEFDISLYV